MAYIPKKVHRPSRGIQRKQQNNWLKNPDDVKFYNSAAWRNFRNWYIMCNPVCENEGCTKAAKFVDHIKPISEGGEKTDEDNVQSLCQSCNGRKTVKQRYK
jgi:5-methylcytosine-specific restriction endonuclease McrA